MIGNGSENLQERKWWFWCDHGVRELLLESVNLLAQVPAWQEKYHDYSFIVFPAAKAYEGFLKKLFLDLGFIGQDQYFGKHFRIGKALNPSLEPKYRQEESVYDRLTTFCGGNDLADKLWMTWKNCRNMIFHWFPKETNAISYEGARRRVGDIVEAMDRSFAECSPSTKR